MNTFLKGAVLISTAVIGVGVADAAIAGSFHKINAELDFTIYKSGKAKALYGDLGHGLTYKVTAGYHYGGSNQDVPFPYTYPAQLTGSKQGLGVDSDGKKKGDDWALDGKGPDEFIKVEFSQDVTLKQLYLGGADYDYYDEFDVGVDNVDLNIKKTFPFKQDEIAYFPYVWSGPFKGTYEVDFEKGAVFSGTSGNKKKPVTGSVFHFYTTDKYDDFRLGGMNIWAKIKKDVPEPAMTLGLLGVGAAMFASRRKRESA